MSNLPDMYAQSLRAYIYRRQGRIHWAKHSRFQPYEFFCGNTFAVPWPAVFIIKP